MRSVVDVDFEPDFRNVTTVTAEDCMMPFKVAVLPMSACAVKGKIPRTSSPIIYIRPPAALVISPERSTKRTGVGKLKPRGFTLSPFLSASVTILQLIKASVFSGAEALTCKAMLNNVSADWIPFGIAVKSAGFALIFSTPL